MAGSDARALSRSLLDLCRMRKLTIATAESCTGGLGRCPPSGTPPSADATDRGLVTPSHAPPRATLAAPARRQTQDSALAAGVTPVARMERSAIRDSFRGYGVPDYASLHPGFNPLRCPTGKTPKRRVNPLAQKYSALPKFGFG